MQYFGVKQDLGQQWHTITGNSVAFIIWRPQVPNDRKTIRKFWGRLSYDSHTPINMMRFTLSYINSIPRDHNLWTLMGRQHHDSNVGSNTITRSGKRFGQRYGH